MRKMSSEEMYFIQTNIEIFFFNKINVVYRSVAFKPPENNIFPEETKEGRCGSSTNHTILQGYRGEHPLPGLYGVVQQLQSEGEEGSVPGGECGSEDCGSWAPRLKICTMSICREEGEAFVWTATTLDTHCLCHFLQGRDTGPYKRGQIS